jgi:hypothetical protein
MTQSPTERLNRTADGATLKNQGVSLWKDGGISNTEKKKRIAIYIEASRCLFTELCTMSDQSTTGRNLYSNTLSISIIGEELPRTHNGETIALSATSTDLQGVLRRVCRSANAASIKNLIIHE